MRRPAQIIAGIVLAGILVSGGSPAAAETASPKETPAAEKNAEQTPPGKAKSKAKSKKRKRAASKCDFSWMKHIDTTPVPAPGPLIPETLSTKCYCQAVFKKYINTDTAHPTMDALLRLVMLDREFKCFYPPPKSPEHILTEDERIEIVKKVDKTDLRFILKMNPIEEYPPHTSRTFGLHSK